MHGDTMVPQEGKDQRPKTHSKTECLALASLTQWLSSGSQPS